MATIILNPGVPPLNTPAFLAMLQAFHAEHNTLEKRQARAAAAQAEERITITAQGRAWLESQANDDDDDEGDTYQPLWVELPGETVDVPLRD